VGGMNAVTPHFRPAREQALDIANHAEAVAESIRPQRIPVSLFDVWRVLESGKAQPQDVTGETLADIERRLATEANHGATFMVLETKSLSDIATLHSYRIRKGKAIGWDREAKRTYAYAADRLFSVEVSAFEPVQPWRYVPGCDVLGASGVIEGRRA